MKKTSKNILILSSAILFAAILVLLGFIIYHYIKGGEDNYKPPEKDKLEANEQVLADLNTLQKAVEAYYTKNLEYPETLDALVPEFIKSIPKDPATGKSYVYETDIEESYSISVPEPEKYNLEALRYENDVLIKE